MVERWVSTRFRKNGYRCVFDLPTKPISKKDIDRLAGQRLNDAGDKVLLASCCAVPMHDRDSIRAKLSAINAVASANIYALPKLVDSIYRWGTRSPARIARLVANGTPAQACNLIDSIQKERRIKYTSAISKYLSFHNDDKWPIYDEWVRKYLWALALTVDAEEYRIEPGYVLYGQPGWSGLKNADSLRNYDVYINFINQLWLELRLSRSNLSVRDKEYVFWSLARKRWRLRKRKSKPLKLRK